MDLVLSLDGQDYLQDFSSWYWDKGSLKGLQLGPQTVGLLLGVWKVWLPLDPWVGRTASLLWLEGAKAQYSIISGSLWTQKGVFPAGSLCWQYSLQTKSGKGWSWVYVPFRISKGTGNSISHKVPRRERLLMDCSWERLEPIYRAISEFITGLNFTDLTLGPPGPWLRGFGARSRVPSGSTARTNVCVPITWGMSEWDSFWVPWHIVLLTSSRSNRVVAESSRVWSCFGVYSWDDGQQVSQPAADLTYENGSLQSWTSLKFQNLLPGSQSCQKVTFAHGWMANYCWQSVWLEDLLFHH